MDDISDHLPSVCVIKSLQQVNKDSVEITSRDTRPKNMKALHEHLSNYQWDTLLSGKTVNDAMSIFNDILCREIDLCIPERTRLVQARNVRREPWITASLKCSIDKSKRLYCKTLQTHSDTTSIIHYKAYNSTLKKSIRHAKRMFYQDKCKEYKTNTKKLWQLINRISGKMNDKSTSIDYLSIDGVREYNGNNIANSLAKYFATVGETFANKIPNATKSVDQYLRLLQSNENNLFFVPCTNTELRKIIQNLPNKKSSGVDQVSNILLKQIGESILSPLSIIINESMSSGVFPDLMKIAEVIPLYKGKARDEGSNYRPISLLTTMSKVLEKVIYTRVYNFLTETGQLCETQYGFRVQHSCEHAVSQLIGTVLKNMENQKTTVSVMLDLSKAFDMIEHEIMLKKLALYGVRGICLNWFRSYLTNRELKVRCRTTCSQEENYSNSHIVNYGTPQGSCLGPLIFLIFVNDMYLHLTDVISIQFTDDTTILFGHRNKTYLKYCIECELDVLYQWFCANKLTLNIEKTVYMVFNCSMQNINDWNLMLGDKFIKRVKSTKFLGLWVDEHLDWKQHVRNLISKLKCGLGMLQRSCNLLNPYAKKLLYFGQVHSHLVYGIGVWGPMLSAKLRNDLINVQNKCVKLLNMTSSKENVYKSMRILNLSALIELEQCKIGYKICHTLLPASLSKLMTHDHQDGTMVKTHQYSTRQKNIPNCPNARSESYRKSFLYSSIAEYSKLPTDIRESRHLQSFTKAMKARLL